MLRLMIKNVQNSAIFAMEMVGTNTNWNLGVEEVFGYPAPEFIGSDIAMLFSLEDQEQHAPEQEREAAAREGRIMCDAEGNLRGYSKIVRDFTERKLIEDTQREALARERNIPRVLQRPLTMQVPENPFLGLAVAARYTPTLDEAQVGGEVEQARQFTDGVFSDDVCLMLARRLSKDQSGWLPPWLT